MRSAAFLFGKALANSAVGAVIPPTLLNVPVRCPRGQVGVVGFTGFKGEPLFLVLTPRESQRRK